MHFAHSSPLDSTQLQRMTLVTSHSAKSSRIDPVLYNPTSTASSNEAGRYLIVNRHISAIVLRYGTKLPTFQLVVRVSGFEGLMMIT